MLTGNENRDIDTMLNEIKDIKLLLDMKVETQLLLQILISKGITTQEEISKIREEIKNSPNYKSVYEYLENTEQKANYYKNKRYNCC